MKPCVQQTKHSFEATEVKLINDHRKKKPTLFTRKRTLLNRVYVILNTIYVRAMRDYPNAKRVDFHNILEIFILKT